MRFLVLEDNPGHVESLIEKIRAICAEFEEPIDDPLFFVKVGREELEVIEKERFDVAIVDIQLKGDCDGFGAIEKIQSDNVFALPKIIICTGEAHTTEDYKGALDLGVFGYVNKAQPNWLEEDLRRAIRSVRRERKVHSLAWFVDVNLRKQILDGKGTLWSKLVAGHEQQMAFMFCDLSNSTRFIQSWRSVASDGTGTILTLMREFLIFTATRIQRFGGVIDKIIGDKVMAYFLVSDDPKEACLSAVSAARAIHEDFPVWYQKIKSEHGGATWPKENIKIDPRTVLHYGKVVWGALGTGDYTSVSIYSSEVVKAALILAQRSKGKRLISEGEIWISDDLRSAARLEKDDLVQGKDVTLTNLSKHASVKVWKLCADITEARFQKASTFEKGRALIIAISHYDKARDLPESVLNDATDVADALKDPRLCGYRPEAISVLPEAKATKQLIVHELRQLAALAGPDDTVMFYFSGHGGQICSSSGTTTYLCPVNFDATDPENTGLSAFELTKLFDDISSRRFVVLLDACHAAGAGHMKTNLAQHAFKSGLDANALNQLGKGAGRVILASSTESEPSQVFSDMRNSIFTHFVLDGLRGKAHQQDDGFIRVIDLFTYVEKQVQIRTKYGQNPIIKTNGSQNFPLALCRGGTKVTAQGNRTRAS